MVGYIAHYVNGRARLRHPLFADQRFISRAAEILRANENVLDVEVSGNSIVVLLCDGAGPEAITEPLDAALPELGRAVPARPKKSASLSAQMRKFELHSLLAAGLACLGLGLGGACRAHVFCAAIFGALSARHVWQRRGAL